MSLCESSREERERELLRKVAGSSSSARMCRRKKEREARRDLNEKATKLQAVNGEGQENNRVELFVFSENRLVFSLFIPSQEPHGHISLLPFSSVFFSSFL